MIAPFSSLNNPSGSFLFDSGSKYFVSEATSLLNSEISGTGQKFSISIWFKRVTVDGTYQTIFSRDGNSGQRQFACEFDPAEEWTFFIADNASNYSWWKTVSTFTSTSVWYNLIATFDNTLTLANKCVIYVQGQPEPTVRTDLGAGVSNVNSQPGEPIYVGVTDFGGLINHIKGYLSNITFYNGILTINDAALIYYSGNTAKSANIATSVAPYMSWNAPSATLGTAPNINDNVGTSYSVSKNFTSSGMTPQDYKFIYPTAPTFNSATTTLAAAMSTPPTAQRERLIDLFITGSISDGNWSLIDAMWFPAAETQQAGQLNWITPASYTLTEVSSPTWTADQGYTFNGTSSYINTNFNTSTNGVNFVLNSAIIGVYERLNINEAKAQIGNANSGTSINIITARNGGNFLGKIHCNVNLAAATSDSSGLFLARRTASNAQDISINGVQKVSGSTASVSVPNNNIYFGCYNNNGTAALFCTNQISFAIIGGGGISRSKLYTRVQNYMTALGTQV